MSVQWRGVRRIRGSATPASSGAMIWSRRVSRALMMDRIVYLSVVRRLPRQRVHAAAVRRPRDPRVGPGPCDRRGRTPGRRARRVLRDLVRSRGGGLPQCRCDRRAAASARPCGRPDPAARPFRPACLTKARALSPRASRPHHPGLPGSNQLTTGVQNRMTRIHPRNRIATLLTTNIRDQVARALEHLQRSVTIAGLRPVRDIRLMRGRRKRIQELGDHADRGDCARAGTADQHALGGA